MRKKPKTLEPILYRDSWHKKAGDTLAEALIKSIYNPLLEAVDDGSPNQNAKDTAVTKALKDGTLRYYRSGFHGAVNSRISKELKEAGAVFRSGRWVIPEPNLPQDWRDAINKNKSLWKKLIGKMDEKFSSMLDNFQTTVSNLSLENMGLEAMDKVSQKFKSTLGKKMSVVTDTKTSRGVTEYIVDSEKPIKKYLSKAYDEGSKKYLSDFAYEEIVNLRTQLSDMIAQGYPREDVRKFINSRLLVGKRRAKFIARQETALLTNKIKEEEYKKAGIRKYIWVSQTDSVTRKSHRDLNGHVISWDNPPIVDPKTGRRAHAGSDFSCRCVQKPVIDFDEE